MLRSVFRAHAARQRMRTTARSCRQGQSVRNLVVALEAGATSIT